MSDYVRDDRTGIWVYRPQFHPGDKVWWVTPTRRVAAVIVRHVNGISYEIRVTATRDRVYRRGEVHESTTAWLLRRK